MADQQQLQEIAKQLRELQRTSPTDRADIASWDASARKFYRELHVPLPPKVMHYLHDADIRIKDPDYKKAQDEMIAGVISDLESGVIPSSTGRSLLFHPRWIGVTALVVLAILYMAVFK